MAEKKEFDNLLSKIKEALRAADSYSVKSRELALVKTKLDEARLWLMETQMKLKAEAAENEDDEIIWLNAQKDSDILDLMRRMRDQQNDEMRRITFEAYGKK